MWHAKHAKQFLKNRILKPKYNDGLKYSIFNKSVEVGRNVND